jgi:hypothetical protein
MMMPDISLELNDETREAYEEGRCTETAKSQDTQLKKIKRWLADPHARPPDLSDNQYMKLAKCARQLYLGNNDKLL